MLTDDFDFDLPGDLIAQAPVEPRDQARLLVRSAEGDLDSGGCVGDLTSWLAPGDLIVVNDTRVLPARVMGTRSTGGRVELLFLEPVELERPDGAWRTMVRPAKKPRPGEVLDCGAGVLATMVVREGDSAVWLVQLRDTSGAGSTVELMERAGAMPLPPYIDRAATDADAERYQTVYAREAGAVAAPTAGLHFTPELLNELQEIGVERAHVTLHVGPGTFQPVQAESVEDHKMHTERFVLGVETADAVRRCRERGGRVIPIGTTSARVLESCAVPNPDRGRDVVEAREGTTDIFLRPGHGPRVLDGLLTNFHLPKSTLLMLVASIIGREPALAAYRHAVEERMRFYSYGDAMLLLR